MGIDESFLKYVFAKYVRVLCKAVSSLIIPTKVGPRKVNVLTVNKTWWEYMSPASHDTVTGY